MLLFNVKKCNAHSGITLFKNILCYCLTEYEKDYIVQYGKFKNILCYCLTAVQAAADAQEDIFKNILCYCLTNGKSSFFLSDVSFFLVFSLFS